MKTRNILILFVCLFVICLVVDRNSSVFNTDRIRWLSALDWTVTAFGAAIAVINAMRLLQAGLQGGKLPQILPAAVGFLAGFSMLQRFWAIPVAFAALLICWLLAERWRPSDEQGKP